MIYGLEPFDTLYPELYGLMEKVWKEVDGRAGLKEMKPDIESYQALTDAGIYRPYTIRTDDKKLIGFIGVFVQKSLHCDGIDAVTDYMYIEPKYRGEGSKLLKLIEDDLREDGIYTFSFVTKAGLDSGHLAENLGFDLYEKIYKKRL